MIDSNQIKGFEIYNIISKANGMTSTFYGIKNQLRKQADKIHDKKSLDDFFKYFRKQLKTDFIQCDISGLNNLIKEDLTKLYKQTKEV